MCDTSSAPKVSRLKHCHAFVERDFRSVEQPLRILFSLLPSSFYSMKEVSIISQSQSICDGVFV